MHYARQPVTSNHRRKLDGNIGTGLGQEQNGGLNGINRVPILPLDISGYHIRQFKNISEKHTKQACSNFLNKTSYIAFYLCGTL